ncbi:MAG: acyltransferase family protein [Actinobacteria bacterium]|nr:acyltransferase family protein [Actinomycetota bacterium]
MAEATESPFVTFRRGQRLEHLPALDGLRGLAVIVVVLFHGNWPWMRGGFLGVSMFFTLSGFLITSLLIAEFDSTGFVDIREFWKRRFRRLLPAAWLTLAVVVAATSALGVYTAAARGDVAASFFNIANWRFLVGGNSYNDLFSEPSPVRHFWSLAIEEQAYVLLPLIVAVVLKVSHGSRVALAAVLGALGAASIALTLTGSGIDRIYYGTDTRAGEILAGALLAVAVTYAPLREAVVRRLQERSFLIALSTLSLAVFLVACSVVSVESPFVSDGGLLVTGALSAILVFAAAAGVGPVATLCASAPLRWMGKISYGVYLFHWPLFVLLTERRTGLAQLPRFVLAVAITVLLAELSSRYFETPLRRGLPQGPLAVRFSVGRVSMPAMGPLSVIGLLTLALLAPTSAAERFDAESAAQNLDELAETIPTRPSSTEVAGPTSTTVAEPVLEDRPPTIMSFGDSVALSITMPIIDWGKATGDWLYVGGSIELGCGIGRGGRERSTFTAARRSVCNAWPITWGAVTDVDGLDIALVHTGQWDILDRQLEGDTVWRTVGDPVYDDYLLGELAAAQDLLARRGALVMWVNLPQYSRLDDDALAPNIRASHDPRRVERLNALLALHTARYPDTARLIDLAGWMSDKIDDTSLRSDGTHFNEKGSERIVSEFFRAEILDGWNAWRSDRLRRTGN